MNSSNTAGYLNLGLALQKQRKLDEAIIAYREAIRIQPESDLAYSNLGAVLQELGKIEEAVAAFQHAIRVRPANAVAHYNLGNAFRRRGRLDEAITAYRRAVSIRADFFEAFSNLGLALQQLGRFGEAVTAHREAISRRPFEATAHYNLAKALQETGEPDRAIASYTDALRLKPDYFEALCNLATVFQQQGRLEECVRTYREALNLYPNHPEVHCSLASALQEQGRFDEARAAHRQALKAGSSRVLFGMNYDDSYTPEDVLHAHQRWGKRYAVASPIYGNTREENRRLKIGYVSPDFRAHSVAFFLEPLLREHNKDEYEIFCYAEVRHPDLTTYHFKELTRHWLVTVGMSDNELSDRILRDNIDILVDLAGHSARNRLGVFARKPAPIQVTWLGYPNTTGLQTIDYRLVDAVTDPPGESDAMASERLFRLDGGFLCCGMMTPDPEPTDPPSLKDGAVTFGSFNNTRKLSPATLDTWATLLARLPQARLFLKGRPFADLATSELFLSRLRDRQVPVERVQLAGWAPDRAAHLALYHQVDVALDPFPYNGTATTCDALWMGVPVVTMRGDRHAARVGASLLSQVDLRDLIANSVEEYVEIAAALARDSLRLTEYHRGLRSRMASSSLCDGRAFARKVEAAYRAMWQSWCCSVH
jgi:predicted O-linked N-acetylglucosamine transferase (SPINDLY family)